MGFRKRPETDLEHDLRAQRPQPREQFVHAVSQRFADPKPRTRPRVAPRLALVAAVTIVLAASLGVAGAVSYAKTSVTSFSSGVYHIVHSPSFNSQNSQNQGTNGNGSGYKYVGDPYQWEEPPGFQTWICFNNHLVRVPVNEFFFRLFGRNGYHTVEYCLRHHG
jgi:hypothetical protein